MQHDGEKHEQAQRAVAFLHRRAEGHAVNRRVHDHAHQCAFALRAVVTTRVSPHV